MARTKKVSTPPTDEQVKASILGQPSEEHAEETSDETRTDTGKYEEPKNQIKETLEEIDEEAGEIEQTPPAKLKAPWDDEGKKEVAPTPKKEEDEREKLRERYDEAVKWNTRLSQDVSDLRRAMEAMREEARKPREPEKPTLTREQLADWRERDPDAYYQYVAHQVSDQRARQVEEKISGMSQMLGSMLVKNEVDSFSREYPDFSDLKSDVVKELQAMPQELTSNPAYYRQALLSAYGIVKMRKFSESESRAKEEGRREAVERSEIKKGSYVEGGGKTGTTGAFNPRDKNVTSKQLFQYMKQKGLVPEG